MEEVKPVQKKLKDLQPSNIEAEQALLGSILVNNDIIDEVATIINSNILGTVNLLDSFKTRKITFSSNDVEHRF